MKRKANELMFDAILNFFRELDRRIKVLYLFLGVHVWHRGLSMQYDQLYATALGANPVELGSLSSLGTLVSSIISTPAGWVAGRYGERKVILAGLALTVGVSAIYALTGSWWMLIPAIILSGASIRLVLPFADMLFINYTKPKQRATVIALSRTLWAIPSVFSPMIAAVIVGHFGGINAAGIRPLYFIQLFLGTLTFICVALWLQAPSVASAKKKDEAPIKLNSFIKDFRDVFKGEKWLKRWIVIMSVRNIGASLAMTFVPLWMVNVKGADPYILGAVGTLGRLVSIFLQVPAGRLADKIGRKKVFYLFCPFTYLGTLLLIAAPNPEYLILVGFLGAIGVGGPSGGLGGVSFVSFVTMGFEMVPEKKRGRWVGISGLLNILSFPASILGGIMWQQGLMMEVLLLPILLEVLIAIPILSTVPDTLRRSRK